MSLETRLQALAAAIGADVKALRAVAGQPNKPALLALQATRAFNRNCRTRGLHPAPPTITIGTSSAPAGHTRSYVFGAAGAPFAYTGGRASTSAGRTIFLARGSSIFSWRVSTIVDSDSVAFLLDSDVLDAYRFLVDGHYVDLEGTSSDIGSERWYRLQFDSKVERLVTVEGNEGLGFWSAAVPEDGQCILPADAAGPQMLYVGDSNAYLDGFPQKGDSCAIALADHLGFRGAWVNSFSGTGFVNNGGNANYLGRQADWTTSVSVDSLDLIVFQQSYNDREQSKVTEKANIAACLAAARERHPNAVIIVHGVSSWNHAGSDVANFQASETVGAEAVAEANDPLIGFIPIYNAAGGLANLPIIGNSAPGDTGTGNTSRYVSHSADHMNVAGNLYFGEWMARRVIEKLAELGGIDVPHLDLPDSATASAGGSGVPNLSVGSTAPSSPSEGDAWLDTSPLTPADFWLYQRFGQTTPASTIFSSAAISSGTNSSPVPTAANLGYNPDGVLLRSGTTANGGWRYHTISASAHRFGGGIGRKFRAQYMPLTDFTGRTVRLGFHDTTTSADAVDGAYFELSGSTCSAKTANNSVRTTHATALTLSLGTVYTFDIDVAADGSSARFRVYAGLSTTPELDVEIATNIPTASARGFGVACIATEASTTASDIGALYAMGYGTPRSFERAGLGPA